MQAFGSRPNIEAEYNREYGVFEYQLTSGKVVTGISAETWDEYSDFLLSLNDPQGIVVSPELITSAGTPLASTRSISPLVKERRAVVAEYSRMQLAAKIVLGTSIENDKRELFNSAVVYQNGQIIGQHDKQQFTFSGDEKRIFSVGHDSAYLALQEPSASLAICAELLMLSGLAFNMKYSGSATVKKNNLITPETSALIVPSCWAVPLPHHNLAPAITPEVRYGKQLEKIITLLFEQFSGLNDIVMIDRAISSVPPYNAHYKRTGTAL